MELSQMSNKICKSTSSKSEICGSSEESLDRKANRAPNDYERSSYKLRDVGLTKGQKGVLRSSRLSCVAICLSVLALLTAGGVFAFVTIKLNDLESKMQPLDKFQLGNMRGEDVTTLWNEFQALANESGDGNFREAFRTLREEPMKGQGLNKAAVESLVRDGLQGLQRELDIRTLTLEAMEQKRENHTQLTEIVKSAFLNITTEDFFEHPTNIANQTKINQMKIESIDGQLLSMQKRVQSVEFRLNHTIDKLNLTACLRDATTPTNPFGEQLSGLRDSVDANTENRLSDLNQTIQILLDNTMSSLQTQIGTLNQSLLNDRIAVANDVKLFGNRTASVNETLQDHVLFSVRENFMIRNELRELELRSSNQTRDLQSKLETQVAIVKHELEALSNNNYVALSMTLEEGLMNVSVEFNKILNDRMNDFNMTMSNDLMSLAHQMESEAAATKHDLGILRNISETKLSNLSAAIAEVLNTTEINKLLDDKMDALNHTMSNNILSLVKHTATDITGIQHELATLNNLTEDNYSKLNMTIDERSRKGYSKFSEVLESRLDALNQTLFNNLHSLDDYTKNRTSEIERQLVKLSNISETNHSELKAAIFEELNSTSTEMNTLIESRIQGLNETAFNNLLSLVNNTERLENLKSRGFLAEDMIKNLSVAISNNTDAVYQFKRLNHLDVRLSGSTNDYEGTVEVQPAPGRPWGTVCDDYWDLNDADVVCKSLGFIRGAYAFHEKAKFGQGKGDIYLSWVACTGTESNLGLCPNQGLGVHNCDKREAAGVTCLT